ncbi:hypothetical protein HDV05_005791 [Chytridiales sp. JEL 0842]|nr:hypothetical protein HDV05_005791 [Chytridiales sp. JEL 0842]
MFITKFLTLVAALLAASASAAPTSNNSEALERRQAPFRIDSSTLAQLNAALRSNQVTSKQLIEFYRFRIARFNPRLKGVLEVNPDADQIAQQADAQFQACRALSTPAAVSQCLSNLPYLLGIPILIKDNIATNDKMENTAGSLALVGWKFPRDSTVAKSLRESGAILFGKAALTEWANFRSTNMRNGWSGRGGEGVNPWDGGDPCGSSSGCGIAVAAGLAPACIGSETFGSILCPSAFNSVTGFKPAPGSVPGDGIIPISSKEDVAGPLCRYVEDCEKLFDIIRVKTGANSTQPQKPQLRIGYAFLGFGPSGYNDDRTSFAPITNALNSLRSTYTLVDLTSTLIRSYPTSLQNTPDIDAHLLCDFKPDLEAYLSQLKNTRNPALPPLTLQSIVDFNNRNAAAERIREYGQATFLNALNGTDRKSSPAQARKCADLDRAYRAFGRNQAQVGIDTLLNRFQLDAILVNAQDYGVTMGGFAGYPVFSLPLDRRVNGALSVEIVTRTGQEAALFKVARDISSRINTVNVPNLDRFSK